MAIAFDTETFRFRPGTMAPELVCLSVSGGGLYTQDQAEEEILRLLSSGELLVGQNVAYDSAVLLAAYPSLLKPLFQAYDEDRVTCTKVREQLIDIAYGKFRGEHTKEGKWLVRNYDLASMARRYFKKTLDKDTWRLKYSELAPLPLAQWPEGAKQYAKEDAEITLKVWDRQEAFAHVLKDQYRQARAQFWLHLSSCWGARTSLAGIEKYFEKIQLEQDECRQRLQDVGLIRKDGTRNVKAVAEHMRKVCAEPRLTDKGNVSLDAESCRDTEDPILVDYALYSELNSSISRELPMLRAGTSFPIHTSYGLAASGRTTSSRPNIQNVGKTPGVREAFVPRAGHVFVQADYEGLELHTLAQVCLSMFGKSRLAEMLNAGEDPHLAFAAKVLKISYAEAKAHKSEPKVKEARAFGKIFNFGSPGGLGAETLIEFAKSSGVTMTKTQAIEFKQVWLETFPEMQDYFTWGSSMCRDKGEPVTVEQLYTNRFRTATQRQYCSVLNTMFQGLGADLAKEAGWLVTKACYLDPRSPLFGSRIIAFVHDEFILETSERKAEAAAMELSRLMLLGASKYLPDVPAKAPPIIMRYWSKNAEAVYENGKLVPWG